ncbi:MAG: hypothetical protein LUG62_04605 [Clostridiales bacterium]|nr:hypothetical protein [Clostridiales bacterium]
MRIIAHRGINYSAPENTAPAFQKAVELGVDGIETDVQLTADGKLVIHHNYSISGTSGFEGMIGSMTLEELKKLDFGSYKGKEFASTPIATLDECLDIVKPLSYVNLELKAPTDRSLPFVEMVIEAVVRHGMTEKVVLSAFDHSLLGKAKELYPQIRVGALTFPTVAAEGRFFGIPMDIFPADVRLADITGDDLKLSEEQMRTLGTVDVVTRSRKAAVMELVYGLAAIYPDLTMDEAVECLAEMNDLRAYVRSLTFKIDYLHPEYHSVLADPSLVSDMREMGIGVTPYTPDDEEELRYLYEKTDCFGLITNRPDILI